MDRLINVGFGNGVNTSKVVAVVAPEAAPIKRMIQKAKEEGNIIDATQGRRTKAVIIVEHNRLVLSALHPATIAKRFDADINYDIKGEEDE